MDGEWVNDQNTERYLVETYFKIPNPIFKLHFYNGQTDFETL